MLLAADAGCINVADAEGDTPLHNAARGGHEDVVRLLVERGADISARNQVWELNAAGLANGCDELCCRCRCCSNRVAWDGPRRVFHFSLLWAA